MVFGRDHGSVAVHHAGLPAARSDVAVLELHHPLPNCLRILVHLVINDSELVSLERFLLPWYPVHATVQ